MASMKKKLNVKKNTETTGGNSKQLPVVKTTLTKCPLCGNSLFDKKSFGAKADLYCLVEGQVNPRQVLHVPKRCSKRTCATYVWCSYFVKNKKKLNVADATSTTLSVTTKTLFSRSLLSLFSSLRDESALSIRALCRAIDTSGFVSGVKKTHLRDYISFGLMYYLQINVITEMKRPSLLREIEVCNDPSEKLVQEFSYFMRKSAATSVGYSKLSEVVMDGNCKLLTKTCGGGKSSDVDGVHADPNDILFYGNRLGRPRKGHNSLKDIRESLKKKSDSYLKGWFERVTAVGKTVRMKMRKMISMRSMKMAAMRKRMMRMKQMKKKVTKEIQKNFSHGYFLVVSCSKDNAGQILDIFPMDRAESNQTVEKAIGRLMEFFTHLQRVFYDRSCKALSVFEAYGIQGICDLFHGRRHTSSCPTNPWVNNALWASAAKVNTNVCEQVNSRLKVFSRCSNNMSNRCNRFFMLHICHQSNKKIGKGELEFLNPYAHLSHLQRSSIP